MARTRTAQTPFFIIKFNKAKRKGAFYEKVCFVFQRQERRVADYLADRVEQLLENELKISAL